MITLKSAESFQLPLRLRMPFRYGIVTLTEVTQLFLRLTFELEGQTITGCAADNLAPKWFKKDPNQSLADDFAELLAVTRAAVRHAHGIRARTAFGFWRELYEVQSAWAAAQSMPPLLAHFGTSMVERALVHASCRAHGLTTSEFLRADLAGVDLGAVHPALAGTAARDWLPDQPAGEVFARHTVGLSDPLDAADVAVGERLDDGLPQTLVECIRFYGLRQFKVKINGDNIRDRERLVRVANVVSAECGDDFAFSVDGNESFRDVGSFVEFARSLLSAPELRAWWPHLLFFEQPWHRDVALTSAMSDLRHTWPDRPPIIVDESDGEIDSVRRALELGYAGASHKNCKGIFKSVANACLLAQRRSAGGIVVLSGEDLTNLGPVALTQDLAMQAALGVTSVERNGHHYFRGLSQFPPALQRHALAQHPDLFTAAAAGWPRLDIRGGRISLRSVNAAPFGVPGELDFSGLLRELM
jgi:hypothetical protein